MIDENQIRTKYDLKTIKIKPGTYNRLVRAKAQLELDKARLHSFDLLINHLIDSYVEGDVYTNKKE